MTEPVAADGYKIARLTPLVVLAEVGDSDRLPTLSRRLREDFPDRQFVGILAADEDEDVAAALAGLRGALAEVIFTASSSPHAVPGFDLATRALEEWSMGQDFVFTVPALADALAYGVDVLAREGDRWDGTGLLVLGSRASIDEALRSL